MSTSLPYYYPPTLPPHLHAAHMRLVSYILIRMRCPHPLGTLRQALQSQAIYWSESLKARDIQEYNHWVQYNLWLPPTAQLNEYSFSLSDEILIASKAKGPVNYAVRAATYYATLILEKRNSQTLRHSN